MENSNKGRLYVVATPIGNLEDITLRALNVLKSVDIIAAEDTRHTLKLLNHFEISKPLISCHRHNEDNKSLELIEKIKSGQDVAIVSDAGTPGISDPGEELIKQCIENNIEVIPIPGACAMINALICSGLDTKSFCFLGFLPLNKKLRKNKLIEIEECKKTVILYEAPHKLKSTLIDLKDILKNRKIVLARELTKIHESFLRGKISEIIPQMKEIKGEMIILIEGNPTIDENITQNNLPIEEQYELYKKQGLTKNEAIKKIAKEQGVSKNEIYMQFLNKE